MSISVTNAGPDTETLHVLPTAWYRNTWSWDEAAEKPELRAQLDGRIVTEHPFLGSLELISDGEPVVLLCENETNTERLFGSPCTPFPKDGINHVVEGAASVGGESGTKAAFWHEVTVAPGASATVRMRLRPPTDSNPWTDFDAVVADRLAEADEFYAELTPAEASEDEALVLRQALAGMLWSKQLYAYDVARWLEGDPTQPAPPASRGKGAKRRLAHLRCLRHHVDAGQVGVPLVRGVGQRLPLRRARARRSRLREVPADPALPRVVPASERRAGGVRVVVRRRQPAGTRVGGARGVRRGRRPRLRFPEPRLRQAARQFHLVDQPPGRRRYEPLRRRVPRPRQHRADRPLAPPGRLHARAVGQHRLDGLLRAEHGRDHAVPPQWSSDDRPGPEVPGAVPRSSPTRSTARGCGTTRTASSTTG